VLGLLGGPLLPLWPRANLRRMITLTVDNPYTGEVACSLPLAEEATVRAVLAAAKAAARVQRHTSVRDRVALALSALEIMEQRKDAIAADITKMMGKPLSQAKGEVAGMAARYRHMCEIAERSLADIELPPKEGMRRRIVREPLGVVLDLPAWNYPLLTAVNAVIPALLAGNAVVLKHSPRSPLCGEHFAKAFADAGAPQGLLQALHCDHQTSERCVGDPLVDHVLFTGSIFGGHRMQAAAAGKFMHVGLELGGNDAAYVAADSDPLKAAESLVDGAMYNAGQSCCGIERVYVHKSLYKAFIEAAEPLVRAYVMGDPMDDKTNMGPIAQPAHPAELEAMVQDARARGARIVCGGKPTKVDGRGRFFEPTLIENGTQDMLLFRQESFGPILPVSVVDSDEEALARMNDSELGLTAAVYTSDVERAERMARELETGTVYMNKCDSLDPALPWVGVKNSGRGATLSALGYEYLTRPKAINFKLAL
jgi:acyl-CoA reductase-like NAD-dependent aldehyde dehydrogenase